STAWFPGRKNRARRRCSRTAGRPPVSAGRSDTFGTARAASTASSLDHVGAKQDLAWNVEREESRRLQIDRKRDVVGGLDGKILRARALQDSRHDAGGLDA